MTVNNETIVDTSRCWDIAYLVGVIDSDGFLVKHGYHREIWLASTDVDYIESFRKAIKNLTGKEVYVQRQICKPHLLNGRIVKSTKPVWQARIVCKRLYYLLASSENCINYIFKHPEGYIRGFADGDGGITYNKQHKIRIFFCNKDKAKLERIKLLLNMLGIQTTSTEVKPQRNGVYVLWISKQSEVCKYMKKVGFTINRKNEVWINKVGLEVKNFGL
jgi:intein-encoded DNA endonuclease-like protein